MSLKTLFPEYSFELSKKYYDHLEFLIQYLNEKPFYQIITSAKIIHELEINGFILPIKSKKTILCKMIKAIRKINFVNYFPVANSHGYMKINQTEQGLAWRQSMKERQASINGQINAFDRKFNYQEPNQDNQNLQITFAHESHA